MSDDLNPSPDHDPQIVIVTPRKAGRPRVPEPGVSVSTWIGVRDYDRLLQRANQQERSLSSLVRDALRQLLR